ncbi:M23 family metallopeptidase [Sphingomonas sp. ID0503]|uniref:M23 family metallopeptidase n=1 Tax=Sphingomonas sp. ID0503 TaxID=3399691 RepID=UPI003AFB5A7D
MTALSSRVFNALTARRFRSLSILSMVLAAAAPQIASAAEAADPTFRSLFLDWKKMDVVAPKPTVSVPSARPVNLAKFTSGYGVRSDPFRHSAAMHKGVDLAGPQGTAIYATADGFVGRAEWASGYGNLVELDHGQSIQTRYGHLSKILVRPGQRVKRGDIIALMGSTGRSTGSHLHYEVRIDGAAVNPIPYLEGTQYAEAAQKRMTAEVAVGGPED